MRKRVIAFLLAGIMSFSTFATGVTTVQAAEKEAVVSVVQQLPMPKESDYANVPTERNFATKVVKDAIEFILKHGDEAAKIIEKTENSTIYQLDGGMKREVIHDSNIRQIFRHRLYMTQFTEHYIMLAFLVLLQLTLH